MTDFKDNGAEKLLDISYERQYDSRFGSRCPHCKDGLAEYKCFECFNSRPLCKDCVLKMHVHAPFHDIDFWNGHFLERRSLSSLGELFPGSFIRPQTAFTAGALRDFHLLTLTTKLTSSAYTTFLRRKTDYWSKETTKDRAREFFTAFRMYSFLAKVKETGVDIPRHRQEFPAGSMATFCAACPQPGINMSPDWKTRPDNLKCVFRTRW
ncbi:hypothetical protein AURDEDRAFT_75829 [Auricularia subglabra TFB-10046 SS5]|uniref:CxC2-like cysteine cluster KDZ transposase-associated domain-containing protein n=1 Tax=Auricularia subglabra (strain TFB-10046 / SS5) TaxID=717982 RepID=J0CWA8_AURST|nr:hypothetical protein AURDEDRAFT_75829 [Auricularia subglabra TFB-10046 SS5]